MRTSSRTLRLGVVVALAAVTSACRPSTVRVSFRPVEGARYAYEVEVQSESVVDLDGREPERRSDRMRFRAEHTVLEASPADSRVQVTLTEVEPAASSATRTFVVRLDRAAQLVRVERVEGVRSDVLGELGLSEIFPEAAGAAPDRPLAPGDRWAIDEPVELPGVDRTRLRGRGRVAELGVENGREIAVVETRTALAVHRSGSTERGRFELTGEQATTSSAVHGLTDGSVERARARTRGEYRLDLRPPEGQDVRPVRGRIVVEVRSSTRRVRPVPSGAVDTKEGPR